MIELEYRLTVADMARAWRAHDPFSSIAAALGPYVGGSLAVIGLVLVSYEREGIMGWLAIIVGVLLAFLYIHDWSTSATPLGPAH